jgi:F-box/TPR repeat protein Pof3
LHDKTTRKLSPAKSVDPFTVLPVELAEMVLEYLAFRNLINSMRVSRGWRDYIAKLPRLWLHLDLSGARRPVPRKFIDKAVRRSENRLTRMTVHRFEHVDVLKNIAKACKSLTELELITLPHAMSSTLIDVVFHALKLEKFVVHPLITLDTVTRIMNARPTLKHVGFNAVRASSYPADWRNVYANLEICNMHFENRTQGATSSLVTLLGHTRMLKTLNTSQVTIAQNFLLPSPGLSPSPAYPLSLTTLVLRKAACSQFPVLVPTLQKVVIEYGGSGPSTSDTGLLRSRLPALTHLSLVDMNPFSHDRMEELLDLYIDDEGHIKELENAVPLQSLTLDAVLANPELGLFKAATGLFLRSPRILTPALQHLNIATLPCTDDEVEQLLTHDTGLVSINLSHTQITGASIKMLADALPNLKSIKADYCPRISGRDAIEYAKRKGVAVSCSMDESKGSRKVRYG